MGGSTCLSEGKLAQLTTSVSVPAVADMFASLLSEILLKCFFFARRKGWAELLENTAEKGQKRVANTQHTQAKGKGTCPPVFLLVFAEQ